MTRMIKINKLIYIFSQSFTALALSAPVPDEALSAILEDFALHDMSARLVFRFAMTATRLY